MIFIVVPTYNEAKNIKTLIPGIHQAMQGRTYTVLVVDDNSPDGTAAIADQLSKQFPVEVLRRPKKLGLGTAYLAGFMHALKHDAEVVFSMDADLSHDPAALPSFLNAIKGQDVVVGSRYIPGGGIRNWAWHRRMTSKMGNLLARTLLGLTPHDVTTGYRCYTPHALKTINAASIRNNGYAFLEEILYRCKRNNLSVGEVPIIYTERREGKSKLGKAEILKFILTLFRLRFFQ